MKRFAQVLMPIALAASLAYPAAGGTLIVEIEWRPGREEETDAKPTVLDRRTNQFLSPATVGDRWSYTLSFNDSLFIPLVIGLEDSAGDYRFSPLAMAAPFFERESSLFIHVVPFRINSSVGAVKKLYLTDPRGQTVTGLHELYQRARLITLERIESLTRRRRRPSVYDLQAAYKFLETAYVLAERTYLDPVEDVIEIRDWLKTAHDTDPARVESALRGTPGAISMIESVDKIEGIRFGKLWNEIEKLPCTAQISFITAYRGALQSIPGSDRRRNVIRTTGISYEEMQARKNICARKIAEDTTMTTTARAEVVAREIEASRREAERLREVNRAAHLEKDAVFLDSILRKLE